jgi:hypothetical protein
MSVLLHKQHYTCIHTDLLAVSISRKTIPRAYASVRTLTVPSERSGEEQIEQEQKRVKSKSESGFISIRIVVKCLYR